MKQWSDNPNIGIRFNQTGYSSSTIFPKKENYNNLFLYEEDLCKAEMREEHRQDWLLELRDEMELERAMEQNEIEEEEGER